MYHLYGLPFGSDGSPPFVLNPLKAPINTFKISIEAYLYVFNFDKTIRRLRRLHL